MVFKDHTCHIEKDGYCDCLDFPEKIAKAIKRAFRDQGISTEEIGEKLTSGKFKGEFNRSVCHRCQHRGMLSYTDLASDFSLSSCFVDRADRTESVFVELRVCLKCGHWAAFSIRRGEPDYD